jgi:hypothetical protein
MAKQVFLGGCGRSLIVQVLVVQDNGEKGIMDAQTAIVVDEAQLSELIQKETHPGPRRTDHFGKHFLTDLRNHQLHLPVFAKVGQQPILGTDSF